MSSLFYNEDVISEEKMMKAHERRTTKLCNECGEEKELSLFGNNHKSKDGYLNQCKVCCKLKRQALKEGNPEIYENQLEASRKAKANLSTEHKQASKKAWDEKNKERVVQYRKDNYDSVYSRVKAVETRIQNLGIEVSWADKEKILDFYIESVRKTLETGEMYEVDHIIPLNGDKVSGLHVELNLQVILGTDNKKKHKKFLVDDIV